LKENLGESSQENKVINNSIKPQITKKEKIFIYICNTLIISMVIMDFLFFFGIYEIDDIMLFIELNIFVSVLAYISYLLKRKIRRRIIIRSKELEHK
jgi:hypothetical protein